VAEDPAAAAAAATAAAEAVAMVAAGVAVQEVGMVKSAHGEAFLNISIYKKIYLNTVGVKRRRGGPARRGAP
jgi:hypothetical protein